MASLFVERGKTVRALYWLSRSCARGLGRTFLQVYPSLWDLHYRRKGISARLGWHSSTRTQVYRTGA